MRLRRNDYALIGIATVASLLILVPLASSAFAQLDFGATSDLTLGGFESFPDDIVMTPPPPNDITPPPLNNIFTSGDSPFNDYTFPPPPQEIEITTPVTGLMTLPEERVESFTFEKFQDGFTWEVDEDGFLYQQWDEDRLGTNPEPKPEYPQVTENYTIVQNEDGTYTFATHSQYISDGYDWKPYILGQDESVVQIQIAGGTVVFDKVAGAVTIFNEYETVIDSDSYTVRTALIGSDVWANLDVNNADVETTVVEDGDKVTVSFIRENDEGKFTTEYVIYSGKVKTTVYFTNYIYENNKFAFTQTLDLPDNIISVNGMQDIDLNDYVGVSFDRATLEENEDLILEIKSIYYNSGLGFDNLWGVNVTTPTKVSLDYANVEQTQTEIGDTVELDPTYTLNKKGAMSPAQSTSSYGNSQGDSLGCGGRIASGTQGYNITWNLRNYVGSWYTWNGCRTAMVGFDLAGIPDTAIISDTKLVYDIFYNNNAGTFDLNQMTQSGQDGWGMWNNDVNQAVGTNPYSVYNNSNWDKTWEMYLDANNLGTQPNGAGSQYAYNLSPAVGTGIVTDLGSAGNADVMAQLKASTSVNGVADWFGIGMPYSAMKNGATASTNWTSQSVQTANTQDMDFENVNLLVTFYSPPSEPTNLTVTPNGSNVDLSWSASEFYSDSIVSSVAKIYPNNGIGAPATWSLWQGGASPTTPTTGVGGVLGTAMDFNGSTDMIGEDYVTSAWASPNQGSISLWIKPEATGSSVGNPIGGTGFQSYWMTNTPLWSTYPSNSFNMGSLYSNANAFTMQQWNHVVVTIDSTTSNNTTVVYVDGSVVPMFDYPSGTGGGSSNNQNSKTASNLLANTILGGQYHPSPQLKYPFEGKIDEFSSWDKVLSQSEVTTLYNSGNGNTPDSINSNNNLITYFPLDETSFPIQNKAVQTQPSADTVTYNIQRDGTNILSTANLSTTDSTASFNVPYQYSISAYNNAGGSSTVNNSEYVVSSDAVSTDGTNNGATTGASGIIGNAWDFDGVNDYVAVPQMALNNSDGHSWSVWANLGGGSGGTASSDMEIVGVANYVNLLISNESTYGQTWASVYYNGSTSGTGYDTMNSGWHHYAGVTDCNGYTQWQCPVTIYMDGTSIGTGTYGMHSPADYAIGARQGSGSQSMFVNGLIDEFAVFERALTSSEIATLYNSGNANTPYALSLGNDLTHYYNFEQTGNTLTNMAVTEDPSSYAVTLTVPAPTGLSATLNIPNVDLSWTGGTGATGYKIEHSTDGANWSTLVANTGNTNTTYTHTAPTSNSDNYYQVKTLIGSDESTGNTATTALTATNYRTYIDNASSTSCVATGTIYEDGSRGNGVPSQGSGNRYCESTSMEYDISGIPDSATIIETDIDEIHNIWTAGWNPSCEYKANTTVQPSTGTGAQKYSATQTGTVYAYDPLCTTTAGTTYNVPLSAQASTDLQNQLSSDWFAISWTMDGFPVLSQTGSGTPSSVNSGSATLNVLHTAPASATVGGVPDTPTGLTATFNTTTADIDLAFTAPANNGSAIVGYKVEVSTDNATWTTVVADTGNTNTTYTDLNPTMGSLNYYKVSAINAYGTGAVSNIDNDMAGLPPDAPTITSTSTDNPNTTPLEITVNWQPPTNTGTAGITNYEVYRDSVLITTVGNVTSYTDTVPTGGGTFVYELKSVTNHGISVLSASASHTTPTPPPTPTSAPTLAIANPDSNPLDVTVSFAMPSSGGSAITSFEIFRSADDITYTSVGTTTTLLFADTVPNDGTFYYKFASTNLVGNSGQSPAGNIATPTAPDAPTVTLAINDPNASPLVITSTFVAPLDNGGSNLIDYTLHHSTDDVTYTQVGSNLNGTFDYTVSNSGTHYFKAEARNNVGLSNLGVSSSIATPTVPTSDSSVTLSIDNPNPNPLDITVSFIAPSNDGGSAVVSYDLHSSPDDITYTQVATGVTADQTVTVPNAGTWYFKSLTTNNVGSSSLGTAVSIATPTVPTIPTNLVLTSVSNTQIDAVWGAPTTDGGSSMVSYTISLETPSGSGNWNVIATVPASQTTYSFTGLTNDVEYQVGIFSSNNVGNNGNMAMTSEFTRPNAPSNFGVQTVDDDELYIGWDVNGLSTSTFTIQTDYTGSWTDVVTDTYANLCIGNSSGFCEYTATGLDSGSNYNYRVFNTNAGGVSENSVVVDGWTLNNAPTGLTVTTTANTSTVANLSWTAPSGVVTGYQIEREAPIGGGWNVIVTDTQNTNVQFDDSPLSLTTEYNYRISAINLGGISLLSNEANVTTLSLPSQPVNVTGELEYASGDYRATISWDAPTNIDGTIIGYKVERNVESAGWTVAVPNTNSASTSVLDINLGIGELYEYRISTITQIGTGVPSSVAEIEHMDGNLTFNVSPVGGNTIDLDVTFSMTDGIPDATPQRVYVYDVDPLVYVSTQPITTHVVNGSMTKGGSITFNDLYEYLAEEKDLYLKFTADQGGFTRTFYSSGNQTATPALAFSGDVFASEIRSSSYTQSTFTINAQPAGYDVLVKYQHQDPTVDPSFLLFEDIIATQSGTLPVVDNVDYYVSVYVDPEGFDYDEVNGVVELVCNDQSPDACVEGTVMTDVPAGAKSSFVVRSERNPDSQQLLGIEGLGDLFGMPMVMLFIIGVGAIFTPRSSQMGIVFIVVGAGLLAYLGYLDFEFTNGATQATWALVILIMLIGIFVGKRWS